ncbi:ATP-dependent DNA helicase, RecD/TraA family [Terribacillus aidingensis]|uniref:ATP-dependent DNA helicase, RecD/TraA family n=1 Tax=Terribacillus aidingensis TaxID=586416 RepID=A0A285NKF5_9BACI|nr:AAA family ATPase [Terribacillus aidingensis]SNZ09980.1 ATP-dependent DNA helicase, RecD/TraA family [Terribacillus aidingensis]
MENNSFEILVKPVRQVFYDTATGYGVYACDTKEKNKVELNNYGNFTINGNLPFRLNLYKEYKANVKREKGKYGISYKVNSIFEPIPETREGQIEYLRYILTDKQVEEILKVHPSGNILKLIEEDKLDYKNIYGIGVFIYGKIKDRVRESKEYQAAFAFLGKASLPQNLVIKLIKHFKTSAQLISEMKKNPYCITQVNGIGFKTADPVAQSLGVKANDPYRIQAAIEYVVDQESNKGHVYCTIDKAIDEVHALINVNHTSISEQIHNTQGLYVHNDRLALKSLYKAEKTISDKIKQLSSCGSGVLELDVERFLDEEAEQSGIQLSEEQRSFFINMFKYNFQLLVGNAGAGKSMLVSILIKIIETLGKTYSMMSPTAKAAKVLAQYTDRPVTTIHKAIGVGLSPDMEEAQQVNSEFVIVEETSMLDSVLCAKLLSKCVNPNVRILFIGDNAQIPSVGAGNILHDLINSDIPKTILTQVFRQKEGGILDIATRTRKQERFLDNSDKGIIEFGNNCTIACVPQEKMEDGFIYYYKKLLEEYDPEEIMALSPTKKNGFGTVEINKYIQSVVNPESIEKKEITHGQDEVTFRVQDYTMNTTNTYNIEDVQGDLTTIVNGDTGKIIDVNPDKKEIIVDFGSSEIPLEAHQLKQLMHSWCITLHKSQGSGSPAVIMLIDKSHKFSLNTNLLYTGITRAKEKLIIITQAETYNYALKKMTNLQRNTFLRDMLEEQEQGFSF